MKLMLVDGNSLTYRAFFALPTDMATASGQVTNAVFGFTSMLINLRPRPPARRRRRRLRPARADVPPRGGRRLQGQPRRGPRHPAPADGPGAPGGRGAAASRSLERAGLRGRRHHRHARHRRPRRRATTSSSSPATATAYQLVEDPHVKVLYNRRGVSDYALYDEAGIVERTGVTPTQYVAVRRAARRPVRQPARRARAWGRRRRPSSSTPTAASTASSPTSTSRRRSCGQNLAEHEAQVRQQRRGDGAAARRRRSSVDLDDLRCGPLDTRRGPQAVRLPRVPHAVRPPGRGVRRRPVGAPASAGGEVLEAEVDRVADAADAVARARRAARRRRRAGGGRGVGGARRAQSPLDGLALVTDAGGGRGGVDPGRAARRRRRSRDALRASLATAAARSPPTTPRR